MARRRAFAALAGALTTAIVVAGCGTGGGDGSRITASAVARETREAGTVRIATTISLATDGKTGPPTGTLPSEGVYDFANQRGVVTTHGGTGADAVDGETRWIGSREYIRVVGAGTEALRTMVPGGATVKPWLAFPSDVVRNTGDDGTFGSIVGSSFLGFGPQPDPARMLDELRKAAREVDVVGRERVRGVDTTHERFSLDSSKLVPTTTQMPAAAAAAEVQTDVWTDADGRLRRLRVGPFEEVTIELELWDYGVPVHVEAPPAEQVTDFAALMRMEGDFNSAVHATVGSGTPPPDLPKLEVTGPWKTVVAGNWRDVRWSVWQASAANEVCTAFEVSPPPGPTAQLPAGIADTLPAHDGVLAECSDPNTAEDDPMPMLTLGMTGIAKPRYRVVAGFAPVGATTITVRTTDGAPAQVPLDASSRVFVWFGDAAQIPATLDIGGREPLHCTLDAEGAAADISQCNPPPG